MITQQIKSNGNLHQPENTLFFIIEEAKETILDSKSYESIVNFNLNFTFLYIISIRNDSI